MFYDETSKFCDYCNKQVLARRKGTNHILHFLLTVFTLGFWLIIWFLSSIKIGGWRCSLCGKKVYRNKSRIRSSQYNSDIIYNKK